MILSWIVYGTLTSLVLGLAALLMERVFRMHGRATRWVWAVAMAAPLVLPFLAGPAAPAGGYVEAAVPVERDMHAIAPAQHPAASVPALSRMNIARIDFIRDIQAFERTGRLDAALVTMWLAASAFLLITLAAGWFRMSRKASSWQPRRIAGTDVLVASDAGPAVFGILHPRIVVPAWLLQADRRIQCATLTHERQHVAAGDPRLLAATFALLVLLPWNLPLWWQWRRLRFAVEVDCDARVLHGGQEIDEYGVALLNAAERRSDIPLMSAAMRDSGSSLEKRIRLMLDNRHPWPRSVAAVLILSAAALATAAAQITPPQASEETSFTTPAAAALGRALVKAAQDGNFDKAVALIDAGADVNRVVRGDGTPMIIAARRGDLRLVQLLLQHGADANLACEGDGNPLIMAAARGRMDVVAALVEHGADVNGVVIRDETPLINAARSGYLDIVKYLVERGADVNLAVPAEPGTAAEIRSPLGEATKHSHGSVAEYLRSQGATA